ncbi:hypothetical protein K474DRAFT_1568888, partial [Panus rudis PR-1116 ss-1]
LPHFLYDQAAFDADPKRRLTSGLLQGPLLLSAHRDLFTGPRTATKEEPGPSPGKASTSEMNHVMQVKEAHIAYTATLASVRFSLNSQECWDANDGAFKGLKFYHNILKLFNHEKWAEPTMKWWN